MSASTSPFSDVLPLAFKLAGVDVLVIGAGVIGARKAAQLIEAGARVTVISEEVLSPLPAGVVRFEQRRYVRGDLRGFFLVVSATGDAATNDVVVEEAKGERLWLNVVDDPDRSSFYFMALHRQGDVTVAVSTAGAAPALAQVVRTLIAEALPDNLARVANSLRDERRRLHDDGTSTEGVDWRPRIGELLHSEDGDVS
ncbi:MAG: bifunctional precorrin-2 dehydrogenase/sirohydrochlorin ferrochelatase [Acidimicrobiales bacterium]